MENQAIFYNTQPAIIDIDTFEKVQEIREQRHRRTKSGNSHMFSGLVFCADCKSRMSFSSAKGDESKWYFTCSISRGKDAPCTAHYIRVIVLERLVWHYTQRVIELVLRYEAHFRAIIERVQKYAELNELTPYALMGGGLLGGPCGGFAFLSLPFCVSLFAVSAFFCGG